MKECDLYEPMRLWLQKHLEDKYKDWDVITLDSHSERLDRVLRSQGIHCEIATGLDIHIDILGIVRRQDIFRLFFIEAKQTRLTIRDLGQLWAYCKLIDPEEAYLMTSSNLGGLNKIMNVFKREDLLDFGDGKRIKKMQIAIWNIKSNSPDMETMIPKID